MSGFSEASDSFDPEQILRLRDEQDAEGIAEMDKAAGISDQAQIAEGEKRAVATAEDILRSTLAVERIMKEMVSDMFADIERITGIKTSDC